MAELKIYKDDVGLVIDIDMGENISSATGLTLYITKPDKSVTTWTPTLQGTNYLRYTTVTDDLNQAGDYIIQPGFTLGSWTGKCTSVGFKVYDSYE